MKKTISLILVFCALMSLGINAFAESCPLPNKNTDAEIKFNDFEWYADYNTTRNSATAAGYVGQYDWSIDSFEVDSCVTPHWATVYNSVNSFAGSETGCGGSTHFFSDLPNVAGYRLSDVELYYMWNPATGRVADYKAKDAVQFYMAKYSFDVTDKEAAYKDLCSKLKGIYGDNPQEDTYGWISPTTYTVWVNGDGACIALGYDEFSIDLVYMAPGAEEKLCKVEEIVKAGEISAASGNVSGL